jgi:NAD(P)-dependent dehydrogenase (short-subunit alcohol dehydrogenase family)
MRVRFAQEDDSADWLDRLHTYELDLCRPDQVDAFVIRMLATFPYVSILINNAAQTIRRPLHYNRILQERSNAAAMLLTHTNNDNDEVLPCIVSANSSVSSSSSSVSSSSSALLDCRARTLTYESPITIAEQDNLSVDQVNAWFPQGLSDELNDGEPLDLRPNNSWGVDPEDTDSRELAEILLTNVHAPITLTVRLLPLLRRSPYKHKYVVQVSSMEGKFARFKTAQHAASNTGKAALNMWVRTTSYVWAKKYGIAQTGVCTGWCSAMHARGSPMWNDAFETPLTCEDGASRILDPILGVENGTYAEPLHGVFLKDYSRSSW